MQAVQGAALVVAGWGSKVRDALSKQHGVLFVAKAREGYARNVNTANSVPPLAVFAKLFDAKKRNYLFKTYVTERAHRTQWRDVPLYAPVKSTRILPRPPTYAKILSLRACLSPTGWRLQWATI